MVRYHICPYSTLSTGTSTERIHKFGYITHTQGAIIIPSVSDHPHCGLLLFIIMRYLQTGGLGWKQTSLLASQ